MTKKACRLTSIIKPSIYITMGIVIINFIMSIANLDNSLLISWSGDILQNTEDIVKNSTDRWALRGQIGDVMSGHFSALAFLAVALGIILQSEANKQMRESLNQQSKALSVQSKSLKAQIKELKSSRRESKKQTEEFFIQNINVKLDRYYRFFDEKMKLIDETFMHRYREVMALNDILAMDGVEINKKEFYFKTSTNIYEILELIFKEIDFIKEKYPESYEIFIVEFKLRVSTDFMLLDILEHYTLIEKYKVTSFLKQIIQNKAEKPYVNPAFKTL